MRKTFHLKVIDAANGHFMFDSHTIKIAPDASIRDIHDQLASLLSKESTQNSLERAVSFIWSTVFISEAKANDVPVEAPKKKTKWGLIIGVALAVIVAAIAFYFIGRSAGRKKERERAQFKSEKSPPAGAPGAHAPAHGGSHVSTPKGGTEASPLHMAGSESGGALTGVDTLTPL